MTKDQELARGMGHKKLGKLNDNNIKSVLGVSRTALGSMVGNAMVLPVAKERLRHLLDGIGPIVP